MIKTNKVKWATLPNGKKAQGLFRIKRMRKKKISNLQIIWTTAKVGSTMGVSVKCAGCQEEFGDYLFFSDKKFPPTLRNIICYLEYQFEQMAMHVCSRKKK